MPSTVADSPARAAILEAAMTIFAGEGAEAARVEDLIAAAQVSRRTFYKYFRSKEEVYAALYTLMTATVVDLVRPAGGKVTLAHVHAGIDAWLDFHAVSSRLLKFLTEQAMRSESLLHPRRQWLREELVAIMAAAARRASRGRKDPLLYWALLSMLEGLSLHLLERGARPAELTRAKAILHRLTDDLLG